MTTIPAALGFFERLRREGWTTEVHEARSPAGRRPRVLVRASRGGRTLLCDAPSLVEAAATLARSLREGHPGAGLLQAVGRGDAVAA